MDSQQSVVKLQGGYTLKEHGLCISQQLSIANSSLLGVGLHTYPLSVLNLVSLEHIQVSFFLSQLLCAIYAAACHIFSSGHEISLSECQHYSYNSGFVWIFINTYFLTHLSQGLLEIRNYHSKICLQTLEKQSFSLQSICNNCKY